VSPQWLQGALETIDEHLSPFSSQLTDLEVASGVVVGEDRDARPLPEVDSSLDPVDVLGQVMIPYLERPPCFVSFSGGRDSSALLAVATAVARREALELPIPITQRFPDAPGTEESHWQELVIRHLDLPNWHRQVVLDDLDFLGPLATAVIRRHGVLSPPQAYGILPLLREARGGSILTGFDGDSLFRTWRWARAASVVACRVRPVPRDIARVALALAPTSVRFERLRREKGHQVRWLRPEARELLDRAFFAEAASEPFNWEKRVRWLARRRALAVTSETHELLSHGTGAKMVHPLLDARFLASFAGAGGRLGFGDFTGLMRAHFGSLLPPEVIARPGKASFGEVFWGSSSREFISTWDGEPVPIEFVDECGLLREWQQRTPHAGSASVLQALWLARDPAGGITAPAIPES
jgi:asparagine synthase (glutamine-hydrolysing)